MNKFDLKAALERDGNCEAWCPIDRVFIPAKILDPSFKAHSTANPQLVVKLFGKRMHTIGYFTEEGEDCTKSEVAYHLLNTRAIYSKMLYIFADATKSDFYTEMAHTCPDAPMTIIAPPGFSLFAKTELSVLEGQGLNNENA